LSAIVKQGIEGGPTLVNAFTRKNGLQGFDSAQVYRGTHAECAAMMASATAAGAVEILEWEQEGAISTITIRSGNAQDGSGEVPFDTFELVANHSQEDISKARAFTELTVDQVGQVTAAVASKQSGTQPTFTGWIPAMADLYALLIAKHTSYYDAQWVFRKTRWLSQYGALKADLTNSFKIFTTAQLEAAEPMPNGTRFALATVDANFPTVVYTPQLSGLFFHGWLKFPGTVNQAGRANKVQSTNEYWLGNWALSAYAKVA